MDNIKIGEFLKTLRKSKGLTQQEVADALYVTQKTISRWERGDGIPDITIVGSVADFYGVSVDEILNGEIKRNNQSEYTVNRKSSEKYKLAKRRLKNRVDIFGIVNISVLFIMLVLSITLGYFVHVLAYIIIGSLMPVLGITILLIAIETTKDRINDLDMDINDTLLAKLKLDIKKKSLLYVDLTATLLILELVPLYRYYILFQDAYFIAMVTVIALFIPYLYVVIRVNLIGKDKIGLVNIKNTILFIAGYLALVLVPISMDCHTVLSYAHGMRKTRYDGSVFLAPFENTPDIIKSWGYAGFSLSVVGMIGIVIALIFKSSLATALAFTFALLIQLLYFIGYNIDCNLYLTNIYYEFDLNMIGIIGIPILATLLAICITISIVAYINKRKPIEELLEEE